MKYIVKFFVVTFFLLVSTHAFAEQKIVVLDLTYVLNESKAGKGAQDFLQKTFDENKKRRVSYLRKGSMMIQNDMAIISNNFRFFSYTFFIIKS